MDTQAHRQAIVDKVSGAGKAPVPPAALARFLTTVTPVLVGIFKVPQGTSNACHVAPLAGLEPSDAF